MNDFSTPDPLELIFGNIFMLPITSFDTTNQHNADIIITTSFWNGLRLSTQSHPILSYAHSLKYRLQINSKDV